MGCYVVIAVWYFFVVVHPMPDGDMFFDLEEQEGNIRRRCRPELQSCFPSQLEWAKLADKLDGKLVWPDDSLNYTEYNYQYNLRTRTYPLVHVVCRTVQDIQNAVTFAKKHNLHVKIKSSGHDSWGRSSAHGSFSINLMEMKHMHVNTAATERSEHGEVTVETGVTFGELYEEVDKHHRVVVGGAGLKVSPGGYMAGGGLGPLSHGLGLGVDSVLEIKIVLADGRIAVCTQNKTIIENSGASETRNNGELFWALRGGGGGTFGVIVHYVLKLHQAPTSIVAASISMPFYQQDNDKHVAKAFLEAYDTWVRIAPSYWGGYVYFNNIPVNVEVSLNDTHNATYHNTGTILVFLNKFGPWDANTESELKTFRELQTLYPEPSGVSIQLVNHSSIWDNLKEDPLSVMYARGYSAGAIIPPEKHNGTLWDFFVEEMMNTSNGEVHCILARLGGKMLDFDETTSSVHAGFRRSLSFMEFTFTAPLKQGIHTFEEQHSQKTNTAQFAAKLRAFGDGDYLNEGYTPSPDWKQLFWGSNYVDLLVVKIRYDPDNLFSCYHCVGSDVASWDDVFEASRASTNFTQLFSAILLLLMATFIHM